MVGAIMYDRGMVGAIMVLMDGSIRHNIHVAYSGTSLNGHP